MHLKLVVRLVCLQAIFLFPARAQDCGVWLPGPKPPDFPAGFQPLQFVTGDGQIFARVRDLGAAPTVKVDLWRFDGTAWILMPWIRTTMGEPDAITFENNQLAVATRRVITSDQIYVETAVRTWNGSSWTLFANILSPYNLICTTTTINLLDLCFFSNAWYVTGEENGNCADEDVVFKLSPSGSTRIGTYPTSAAPNQLETFAGAVYLAGKFTSVFNPTANVTVSASNIARWTGTVWQDVAGGVNSEVVALRVWQENLAQPLSAQLVVAGRITLAGNVAVKGIAIRSQAGQWSALGSGVDWPIDLPFGGSWHGPAVLVPFPAGGQDVDLIVGGLTGAGGSSADDFARWTGSAWVPWGIGLNSTIHTAITYNNEVVAGGGFSGPSAFDPDNDVLFGVGRFDGTAWKTLSLDGTDGIVRALFTNNGTVYAGGNFTTMNGVLASHIAARTNNGWEALGSGLNGPVLALTAFGGEIIAGGAFGVAGGAIAHNIAAWNGTTWRALGTGFNNQVNALTVWNNQLVAVGTFIGDGQLETALPGIAVWNGIQWSKLHPDADIAGSHAVAVHNGFLHFGGEFPGGIARWTGSQLELVGGGVLGGSVFALTSLAGSLYVGGNFVGVGNNQFIPGVARWTGSQWLALNNNGNSANVAGEVRTLLGTANELYAGGSFQVTSGLGHVTRNMARWNGVDWRALADSYPAARVHTAALTNDRLWAGGEFLGIADGTVSAYIAERTEGPGFKSQPEQQDICANDGTKTVEFSAEIVADTGTVFRWQKNQVSINDSLRISGATTQTLSIFGVLPGDAGNYRLRATDECANETYSETAVLTFDGCCPGDMNNDHAANLIDADLFVDCLAGPQVSASCQNASRANFDGDSDVDLRDAAGFQRAFAGACP